MYAVLLAHFDARRAGRRDQARSVLDEAAAKCDAAERPYPVIKHLRGELDEAGLLAAATEWKLDLSGSFLVGDRWRDIEAGHRAGCKTIFVDGGYREERPEAYDREVQSLAEAAAWILANFEQEKRRV